MAFLIRKISRSKWVNVQAPQNDQLNPQDLSSDALTSCLRTTQKTLSFWLVDDINDIKDESKLSVAVLALVANKATTSLGKLDIIYFPYDIDDLKKKGFIFDNTTGDTTIQSYQTKHLDMIDLNLEKIVSVANFFCELLNKGNYRRVRESQIKQFLIQHLEENPNDREGLSLELLEKLGFNANNKTLL